MKRKYCLPIIKFKLSEVLKVITENQSSYDFFELWLDYIFDINSNVVKNLIKRFDGKLIFLFRRKNLENPKLLLKRRLEIIDLISGSKCFIDLDISQKKELEYLRKNSKKIRLIASFHDYKKTPLTKDLEKILEKMGKLHPEIYKISTFCKTDSDALRLLDLLYKLKERNLKCIILGMGEKGKITRIGGAIVGNEMNFAPTIVKEQSALGQLTKSELEAILNRIKICYIVADPVEFTLSPPIHNAAYKALNIQNDFIFLRKRVKSENLKKFTHDARKDSQFRGASVSLPHKVEIMKYLDEIDRVAKSIGAVNTIIKEGNILKGYNTDYLGILNSLNKVTSLTGKTAAVLGAGGAARAAVYALTSSGAKVTIFNRDVKKAKDLAKEFNCDFNSLDNISRVSFFDIVINATKVGLNDSDTPLVTKKLIKPNQIIFDVVYFPGRPETKFLKEAKQKKAKTISGIEMLLFQAVEQFKLFTNKEISVDVLRKSL